MLAIGHPYGGSAAQDGNGQVVGAARDTMRFQDHILAKEHIEFTDFEDAALRFADCVSATGIAEVQTEFREDIQAYQYTYKNISPAIESVGDASEVTSCHEEYLSELEWEWAAQQERIVKEHDRVTAELLECLKSLSLIGSNDNLIAMDELYIDHQYEYDRCWTDVAREKYYR